LPERAFEAGFDPRTTLEDMQEWIEENEMVTMKQLVAIVNITNAIERWL